MRDQVRGLAGSYHAPIAYMKRVRNCSRGSVAKRRRRSGSRRGSPGESTSSRVVTSGGMIRIDVDVRAAVRTSSRRSKASPGSASSGPGPGRGRRPRRLDSSSASISPRPRTSPIDGWRAPSGLEPVEELRAALAGVRDEPLLLDDVERRERGRARRPTFPPYVPPWLPALERAISCRSRAARTAAAPTRSPWP
jgi:hypothetical protein